MNGLRIGAVLAMLGAASFVPTQAQSVSSLLSDFFREGIRLEENGHEAHFEDQGSAALTVGQLNRAISSQFANAPLGSSSGAFTFTFDPELGTASRASESFGPIFAERALTLGKNNYNLGMNYANYSFDSFEGYDLSGGDLAFTLFHQDEAPNGVLDPFFEGDVIDTALNLDLNFEATTFFFNYGVHKRIDIGIAVPLVRAEMDAQFNSTILAVATGSGIHQFAGGALQDTTSASASASGVGDVVLRGKYAWLQKDKYGLAVGADIRLPTGDDEDLLGAGTTQSKIYLAGSGAGGRVSPHANVSYSIASGESDFLGELPDELNIIAGFDAALSQKTTFALDFIGRTIFDAQRLGQSQQVLQYNSNPAGTPLELGTLFRTQLEPFQDDMTQIFSAVGFKFNAGRTFLISANALIPIERDRGLIDDLSLALGLEYDF